MMKTEKPGVGKRIKRLEDASTIAGARGDWLEAARLEERALKLEIDQLADAEKTGGRKETRA
jgi:hypothetical protein